MTSYNVTWNISKVHWMLIEMFGHCSISPQQICHLTIVNIWLCFPLCWIRFLEQLVMYPFCFCPCHSGSTLTSHGSSWRKEKPWCACHPSWRPGLHDGARMSSLGPSSDTQWPLCFSLTTSRLDIILSAGLRRSGGIGKLYSRLCREGSSFSRSRKRASEGSCCQSALSSCYDTGPNSNHVSSHPVSWFCPPLAFAVWTDSFHCPSPVQRSHSPSPKWASPWDSWLNRLELSHVRSPKVAVILWVPLCEVQAGAHVMRWVQ